MVGQNKEKSNNIARSKMLSANHWFIFFGKVYVKALDKE